MQRREFIAGIGSAAVWPVVARAQQQTLPVIGFLSSSSPESYLGRLEALDPLASKGVRQAGSTFSISHRLASTVASYFFGSPPRNFVTGLMVLTPFLSYSTLP